MMGLVQAWVSGIIGIGQGICLRRQDYSCHFWYTRRTDLIVTLF